MQRKVFKLFLVLNIIIDVTVLIFIISLLVKTYFNGIEFGCTIQIDDCNPTLIKGLSGIKKIITGELWYIFILGSAFGIIPIINLPIITFLSDKTHIYQKRRHIGIKLAICMALHIVVWCICLNNTYNNPIINTILVLLPYIECLLISIIILQKGKKKESKD